MTVTTQKITRLLAATVDVGLPGTDACEIRCDVFALADEQWEAVGWYSTGNNQGYYYYQENFVYGPWTGRGHSPDTACDSMLRLVDADYLDGMRQAIHDALMRITHDTTFAILACREANRIERLRKEVVALLRSL